MREITRRAFLALTASGGLATTLSPVSVLAAGANRPYDVVVYGGTPAGVMAAVAASRAGFRVALVDPSTRLGGVVASGLGWTDLAEGQAGLIGGLPRSIFFSAVERHYGSGNPWRHAPGVALSIFTRTIREAGVQILIGQHVTRVARAAGKRGTGPVIDKLILSNGSAVSGRVFIDCTYEGDLMASSGVPFMIGRESAARYGEALAGVEKGGFIFSTLSPYDSHRHLLPEISSARLPRPGQADTKVQAYNFRLCLSSQPGNMVRFSKPPRYDPGRYALLKLIVNWPNRLHQRLGQNFNLKPLPGGKWDLNDGGFFSTDYVGGSYAYPGASHAQRRRIWQSHYEYQAGLLYFLATDHGVPSVLREELNGYGLAKDEFTDSRHWPPALYVREARRMIGEYVMTERDVTTSVTKADAIGMGAYPMDCHYVQRVVVDTARVMDEGDLFFDSPPKVVPYQIPFRALLPARGHVANLLVPVCVSASHVAYCSLRTEAQYMVMGHAAGAAAALSLESRTPLHSLDTKELRSRLGRDGAVLAPIR